MMHHGRGVIYLALTEERDPRIGLFVDSTKAAAGWPPIRRSFTIRAEGIAWCFRLGRAHTIRAAVADQTKPLDLMIPGHVLLFRPARRCFGAVRQGRSRRGSDSLAGFKAAGVICQILEEDGSVALLPSLELCAPARIQGAFRSHAYRLPHSLKV